VNKNAPVLVSPLYCQLRKHVTALGNTLFSLFSIHLCNWRSAINHLKNQCSGNWYSSKLLISNWTVMWEVKYFHICNDTSVLHSDYTQITYKQKKQTKKKRLYNDTDYILICPQLLRKYMVLSKYTSQLLAMPCVYVTSRMSHGHTTFVCLSTVQPLHL